MAKTDEVPQAPPEVVAVHRDHIETSARLMARVHRARFRSDSNPIDDAPDGDEDDDDAEDLREIVAQQTLDSGRIAIIQVCGVLARGVADYEGWGLADYQRVTDAVEDADGDDNIDAIVLVVDSPGGSVMGCPEAAAKIAGISKPMMVFSSGLLCSAAYYLTASADLVVVTPSSGVGSIGCYRPFWDLSAGYGQMGVVVHVFASGAQKGAGYPGTSLTDEQSGLIQSQVDAIAGDFQTFVLQHRPEVDLSLFDGRDVRGSEAVALGLADSCVVDFAEAINELLAIM